MINSAVFVVQRVLKAASKKRQHTPESATNKRGVGRSPAAVFSPASQSSTSTLYVTLMTVNYVGKLLCSGIDFVSVFSDVSYLFDSL